MCQNVSKCVKMCQNMCQNVSKCVKICQNVSKYVNFLQQFEFFLRNFYFLLNKNILELVFKKNILFNKYKMNNYVCQRCGFETKSKRNMNRHLNRKHICQPKLQDIKISEIARKYAIAMEENIENEKISQNIPKISHFDPLLSQNDHFYPKISHSKIKKYNKSPKITTEGRYKCHYCSRNYKNKYHCNRHIKKCKHNPNNTEDDLQKHIEELQNEKKEMKKQIDLLINHVNCVKTSTTNNTTHNNTTNYIQQNIVISSFGNEKIGYIKKRFLDKLIKAPFGAIPKLIKAIHFHPEHPENHNVRITNKKQRFADVCHNNKWVLADKKKVINDMIDKGFDIMDEHHEENNDQYDNIRKRRYSKFKDMYEDNDKNLKKRLEQDIEIEILNNS